MKKRAFIVGLYPSFSRHAKDKVNYSLVIWLNENVKLCDAKVKQKRNSRFAIAITARRKSKEGTSLYNIKREKSFVSQKISIFAHHKIIK